MTTSQNNLRKGIISGEGVKSVAMPISNAVAPFKQGDLLYLDTSAHYVKPLDSDAHAATLVGVAGAPSAPSSNIDNGSAPAEKGVSVLWDGIFDLQTTASETYYHGTDVYAGADAQTITTVAGTNKVGTVALPPHIASIAGAAGVAVPVLVKSKVY